MISLDYAVGLVRQHYREAFDLGVEDAKAGRWRELVGDYETMAYEIGRMYAAEPDETRRNKRQVNADPMLERALRQMVAGV